MAETTCQPSRHHRPARLQADLRGPPKADSGWPRRPSRRAKRPVILAGHGVLLSGAVDELRAFAEKTQIPVAHTLLGVGAIDERAPAELRLHGHARLEARQPRHPVGRPAHRAGHALRRPGHRQGQHLRDRTRASSMSTSTRPRSARTWPWTCPSWVTSGASCGRSRRWCASAIRPTSERTTSRSWPSGARSPRAASWHGSGAWRDGLLSADYVIARLGELTDHDADAGVRRRPAPDVARALRRLPPPDSHSQLGRPGHDGLRPAGGDGRRTRAAGQGDLGGRRRRRASR